MARQARRGRPGPARIDSVAKMGPRWAVGEDRGDTASEVVVKDLSLDLPDRSGGSLLIHEPGPLTTTQDLGRPGYLRVGIPESGPVDRDAFVLANRLVGNADEAAGLECTLMGPRLEFTDERVVAVTGADLPVALNGAQAPRWEAFRVKAGDGLKLGAARTGVRAYVAISGGIDTPPALGSRATYVRGQLGGLGGRRLEKGDGVPLGRPRAARLGRVRAQRIPDFAVEPEISLGLRPPAAPS